MIRTRQESGSYTRGRPEEMCFMGQPPVSVALCSSPLHFTEGTPLSDCCAGTEPSCSSAVRLELKQKETICTLLPETLALAFLCRGGRGKMLALSRGDVWHRRATLCFAACTAREHVSLIRQQQRSLSLQGKEQAQISPLEAAGPCRLLARVTVKTREMSSRVELPVRDSRPVLSQKESKLTAIYKMVDVESAPFICWFYQESREIISSEVQT